MEGKGEEFMENFMEQVTIQWDTFIMGIFSGILVSILFTALRRELIEYIKERQDEKEREAWNTRRKMADAVTMQVLAELDRRRMKIK